MTSRIRRLCALVAGATAVLFAVPVSAGAATPASPPSPDPTAGSPTASAQRYRFLVEPHDVSLGLPGSSPGKRITASVSGYAPDPRVTIDVSGLTGVADARFTDPRCTASGAKGSCRLPSLVAFEEELELFLTPAAQAKAGDHGTIIWDQWPPAVVPGNGDDTHEVTRWTTEVTIVDGGDLVVTPIGELPTARPGSRVTIPLTVTNAGSQPTNGLTATFRLTHGLRPAAYANCRTQPYDPPFDNSTDTICTFPRVLQPGATYDVQLDATVEAFASRWQKVTEFVAPRASGAAPESTAGPRLLLTARQRTAASDEIDSHDNFTVASLGVDTGLDLAAVGATITGDPGDVVKAEVGFRNIGPSEIDPVDGLSFLVQPPAGAEVVSSPCRRNDDGQYVCHAGGWLLAPGEQALIELTLRVKAAAGADGSVRVVYRRGDAADGTVVDDKPANDTAPLRIVSRGAGLPITGVSVLSTALAGVVVLVIGILAVLVSRRPHRPRS